MLVVPDHSIAVTERPRSCAGAVPNETHLPIVENRTGVLVFVPKRVGCGENEVLCHQSSGAEPGIVMLDLRDVAVETIKIVRNFHLS